MGKYTSFIIVLVFVICSAVNCIKVDAHAQHGDEGDHHSHKHHSIDNEIPHDPNCNDPSHEHCHGDHSNAIDVDSRTSLGGGVHSQINHSHDHNNHADDDHHHSGHDHSHDHAGHDHSHDHAGHDHSHDHAGHYHHPLNPKAKYVPPENRKDGMTPLMSLILRNEEKKALDMIVEGVDVTARNKDGISSLMFALGKKQYKVAKRLIALGADVTTPSKSGLTPLMIAVGIENTEVIEMLVKNGADIEELAKTYARATSFVERNPDILNLAREVRSGNTMSEQVGIVGDEL